MYLLLFKASHQFFFFKCVCFLQFFWPFVVYVWNSYENVFRFVVKFTKQLLLDRYKLLVLVFFSFTIIVTKIKVGINSCYYYEKKIVFFITFVLLICPTAGQGPLVLTSTSSYLEFYWEIRSCFFTKN